MPASREPLVLRIGQEELVIRRRYEVVSIVNDLLIAIWFLVGSLCFFDENLMTAGTWLFVVGSLQLAIRPVIRLGRRVHLRRFGGDSPTEASHDF